ncbi:hypothetical protein [Streptomyces aureus]|nr:hypothetical protein [Streptomyces aureus]
MASTPTTRSTTAGLDQPGSMGSVSRNATPASTAAAISAVSARVR